MSISPEVPPSLHSYTVALTPGQVTLLKPLLEVHGFEWEEKPYTIFAAKKEKLRLAVYEKGPKLLLQGKGIEDFVTFILEPYVLGEARLGYEEVHAPERFEPHFGVDESGKGDFLGPLVIAGVYLDGALARKLRDQGVRDSKGVGSDKKIHDLAKVIRHSGAVVESLLIGPQRYNQLYQKIGNLNQLLAWGHAKVLENLCEKVPSCQRALSDQFANPKVLERALQSKGRQLLLEQKTKAESDYAVAAASIIARDAFVHWMDRAEQQYGVPFYKGASPRVKQSAQELVEREGPAILSEVAKTHFKTARELIF